MLNSIGNAMEAYRINQQKMVNAKDEDELLRTSLAEAPGDTVFLFKKEDEGLCGTYSLEACSINDRYTLGIPRKTDGKTYRE